MKIFVKSMERATRGARRQQSGFVLIMTLVVVALVSIIGVSIMNITTVEARLAGNMQETMRALGLAESSYDQYFNVSNAYDPASLGVDQTYTYGSMGTSTINNIEKARGHKPPRSADPGQIYSVGYGTANYEFESTATTTLGGKAVLQAGVTQIIPSQNN